MTPLTYNDNCQLVMNITPEMTRIEKFKQVTALIPQQCDDELGQLQVYFEKSDYDVRQVIDLLYYYGTFTPEINSTFVEYLARKPYHMSTIIIATLGILCNVFCLAVMVKIRMTLSGHRLFIMSLCLSDALISSLVIWRLRMEHVDEQLSDPSRSTICYDNFFKCLQYSAYLLTLLNLIGMAVDHYIGILQPLYYCRWMSTRNTTLAIVIIWVVGLFVGVGPYLLLILTFVTDESMDHYCFMALTYANYYYPAVLLITAPIAFGIIFFSYFRIYKKIDDLHRKTPRLLSQIEIRKATVTTLLIVFTFLLFWGPWCIHSSYLMIRLRIFKANINAELEILTEKITFALMNFNSLADPLIYTFRMAKIRKRMANVLCIEAIRKRLRRSRGLSSFSGLNFRFSGGAQPAVNSNNESKYREGRSKMKTVRNDQSDVPANHPLTPTATATTSASGSGPSTGYYSGGSIQVNASRSGSGHGEIHNNEDNKLLEEYTMSERPDSSGNFC